MLKKGQPVILLAGEERFLKEETLARIKSAFLDQASRDFNFNVFYAGTTTLATILECASTVPFLGPKRLVLVHQAEEFSSADKKLILSYVKTPQKKTVLILETDQTNLKEDFFRQLCKYAQLIFCKLFPKDQIYGWIKRQAKLKGKTIEQRAEGILVENLGTDLQLLSAALENLTLYIGERQTIKVDDVQKLVGPDLTTSSFDLFDAVVTGNNKEKAFFILDSLFKDGVNSSQILGALAHQVISKEGRMNRLQFERTLAELQKTDADIKTGRQTQRFALELLLVRLLQLF